MGRASNVLRDTAAFRVVALVDDGFGAQCAGCVGAVTGYVLSVHANVIMSPVEFVASGA
jgi:hypothetical protein